MLEWLGFIRGDQWQVIAKPVRGEKKRLRPNAYSCPMKSKPYEQSTNSVTVRIAITMSVVLVAWVVIPVT